MAGTGMPAPTNERILQLLEEVRAELAESRKHDERVAADLKRLLER
ncbi:MAG: hypothetical protein ACRDKV_02655 [Solirubrobacterales bacterium]